MPVFFSPARVHAMMQEQALSRELKALEGLKLAPVVQATRVRDVQGSIYGTIACVAGYMDWGGNGPLP